MAHLQILQIMKLEIKEIGGVPVTGSPGRSGAGFGAKLKIQCLLKDILNVSLFNTELCVLEG